MSKILMSYANNGFTLSIINVKLNSEFRFSNIFIHKKRYNVFKKCVRFVCVKKLV